MKRPHKRGNVHRALSVPAHGKGDEMAPTPHSITHLPGTSTKDTLEPQGFYPRTSQARRKTDLVDFGVQSLAVGDMNRVQAITLLIQRGGLSNV
jgi:hypothetical protein